MIKNLEEEKTQKEEELQSKRLEEEEKAKKKNQSGKNQKKKVIKKEKNQSVKNQKKKIKLWKLLNPNILLMAFEKLMKKLKLLLKNIKKNMTY